MAWRCIEAETGKQGLREAATRKPDLVVLDLGLPDTDGIDVIRELRGWTQLPVIVLSARTQESREGRRARRRRRRLSDQAFRRVRAAGARCARSCGARNRAAATIRRTVRFGEVVVDLGERQVTRDGAAVHLTPTEYRLLTVLMRHAGPRADASAIAARCVGTGARRQSPLLRVYMGHLRQKLEQDPAQPSIS